MAQIVASVLDCFLKLMRKQEGDEPKACEALVEWFDLQFVGGVVPRHAATVGAVHCDCSGHPEVRCRLTGQDGVQADATVDRQQDRRSQHRRPGGNCTGEQVAALDERIDQAHHRQEEPAEFGHAVAAVARQFERQDAWRDAARDGGGRGRGRGTFQRGRDRGPGRDRDRERDDHDDDDAAAREVERQIHALGIENVDVGAGRT